MRATALATLLAALLACVAIAARAEPMEDVDYLRIQPPLPRSGTAIEVVEFFYYGCGACYRLEPLLNRWAANLPEDVQLVRVPALRNTSWIPLTRLFFALDKMGVLPQVHDLVYQDIHESGLNLGDSSRAAQWVQDNGLDRAAFLEALESDDIKRRVQFARDLTTSYGVRNTPSIAVDGRFLTSAAMTGSADTLLPVVDALIDMARASRKTP